MSKQKQFIYTTCSELLSFMYWTCNSMNNLLSYCGLVDMRISAPEKDLPVSWIYPPEWLVHTYNCKEKEQVCI